MTKPDIAILSTCAELRSGLKSALRQSCRVTMHSKFADVAETLQSRNVAGVIADVRQTSSGGHEEDRVLSEWERSRPNLPVVMIGDESCPEILERRAACCDSVRLLKDGDPLKAVELLSSLADIAFAEESAESGAKSRVLRTRSGLAEFGSVGVETVLNGITRRFETNTPQMKEMLEDLEVAAGHDVTILLIGETGTGKTFLARLVHEISPRRDKPFVTVACGALPADLIESELFGHVKGAFTSAHADKEGKFVAAAGGTILLDEIDVLGPEQQVKLLRVIETGEFEPVGSNETITCRARLVVASNLDLQPLVEQGKFRADLYYRLNMLKFDISPLRERRADIVPLAHKFVAQLSEKHGITIESIDRGLFETLQSYPWPGNVRELENVLQRAVIYSIDGVLSAKQLPRHMLAGDVGRIANPSYRHWGPANDASIRLNVPGHPPQRAAFCEPGPDSESPASSPGNDSLGDRIADTEREIISAALYSNNFSRTNTARDLGISRVTLYNKMKKYGIA